jgi:hypothetical protein
MQDSKPDLKRARYPVKDDATPVDGLSTTCITPLPYDLQKLRQDPILAAQESRAIEFDPAALR